MKIIVTGSAGFIGFHLVQKLLQDKRVQVVGIDNINDYYDPQLKRNRMAALAECDQFRHVDLELSDRPAMEKLFQDESFDAVVNLAAQAGVRYSLINPHSYVDTNLVGFVNILEGCRHSRVKHLVYASSSSVYGANTKMPFSVHDNVDHPVSLYAASKKANELMAHTYSHLYDLPTTGLRFFTVYGPWGRPDMAMWKFAKAILADEPIDLYNQGVMCRDFTYVDDVVESVVRLTKHPSAPDKNWNSHSPDSGTSSAPWRVYNIGNHSPTELLYVVSLLEKHLGKDAKRNLLPMQPGDVSATYADVEALTEAVDFKPSTSIEDGIASFVQWYLEYHQEQISTVNLKKTA